MKRIGEMLLTIGAIAVLAMSTPAFASSDGVVQIDQGKVMGSGGFPFHINHPGSYRLSGDLLAPGTTAIIITSQDVTLDLNGFSIACTGCSGVPGIQAVAIRAAILNGNVTGFKGGSGAPYGIYLQAASGGSDYVARIDKVNAEGNAIGIFADPGVVLSVSNSSVSFNSSIGINSGPTGDLTVTNSQVSNNGLDGIVMGSGVVTGSAITNNGLTTVGLRGGIGVGGTGNAVTITNNTITGNAVFGIFALDIAAIPVVGYGSNTFGGNVQDVSGAFPNSSMKNNMCSFGVC